MGPLLSILKEYQELGLSSVVDYDKFNAYALTHHSTRLEGSTLTSVEAQVEVKVEAYTACSPTAPASWLLAARSIAN